MPDVDPAELRRFTRSEFHHMRQAGWFDQQRVELVHGLVRRMSPMGAEHSYSVRMLVRVLVPQVLDRAEVFVQLPMAASEDSQPEPDFALTPLGQYLDDHPEGAWLVVEVSESSLSYDRQVKGPLYASMGVPAYWIVNLVDRVIEVHAEPGAEGYAQVTLARGSDLLTIPDLPGVTVRAGDLMPPA